MAGNKFNFAGKRFSVDLRVSKGVRAHPAANARARAIAKCARGKGLEQRKECFSGNKIKGK